MTSSPTTTRSPATALPMAVAGLAHHGETWHLAIVAPPATAGALPRVVSARALAQGELEAQGRALSTILRDAGVSLLVKVAPGAECYAKMTTAPEVPETGLSAAVSLLAEINLPEDLPKHRRASGIVRTRAGTAALFTGWRGTGSDDFADGVDEFWIAEPAALVGLMGTRADIGASWDAGRGSIVVAATGETGVVRCLRGDRSRPGAFIESLEGAVRSTAAASHNDASGLTLDPADRPVGFSIGDGWTLADVCQIETVARSGALSASLAIGAALSVLNQTPGSSSLAALRSEHDGGPDPKLIRVASWLGKPGVAGKLVTAAVLVAVFAPIGLTWARLAVVNSKADELKAAATQQTELAKKAALYKQLDTKRWPMAKLLAEVSAACPQGVMVETLTIESEGSQDVLIKGVADSSEILSKMTKNLNDTGLFGSVVVPDTKADSDGLNFTLRAKVSNAKSPSKPIDDFATRSLRERLYADNGKGAAPVHIAAADEDHGDPASDDIGDGHADTPAGGATSGDKGKTPALRNNNAGRGGRGNNAKAVRGETAVAGETNKASKGPDIPEVLTDEQIGAMTNSALTLAWAKHKAALSKSDLDPAVKARLDAQLAKIDAKRSGGAK